MRKNEGPRVLLLDIETAPLLTYVWHIHKNRIGTHQIEKDWFMLSWAAKWHGEKKMYGDSCYKHNKHYKKNPKCDKKIMQGLWDLMNEADFVITHNGNGFDIPKIYTRFLLNGFTKPSPFKSIDTMSIAKHVFGFTSNSLDYIANLLGVGGKYDSGGMDTWKDCLKEKKSAWDRMLKYNKKDVELLEKVYNVLRSWNKRAPNFAMYVDDNDPRCIECGSKDIKKDGTVPLTAGKYQTYRCNNPDCGRSWMRGNTNLLSKEKRKSLLKNVI